MANFIGGAIVGAILGLVAAWLMEVPAPDYLLFGGIGAGCGAFGGLPLPPAVKGTVIGAVLAVVTVATIAFFWPSTKGFLNNSAVFWGSVLLGAIFGGMVGHNMNAEGEDEAEST